jgi:hypothetical protein
MNGVYKSLKVKVQDTLQMAKINSTPIRGEKSAIKSSLDDEMEQLEKVLAERISRLRAAVKQGEAAITGEARQAEQIIGSLKASIAVLESKLKETEETLRKKDSSRQQIEETLKAKLQELQNDAKKKEEELATRGKEINDIRSNLDSKAKQLSALESAGAKAKEEAASNAKRAESLAETSRVKITTLESQLKEREDLARNKDATIKELEHKLAVKTQDFDSLARNKQELLVERDAVISDLKSQLKLLTKGIGEMSSFFKQAQAFAVVGRQDASAPAPNSPPQRREEKPVIHSNGTNVAPFIQEKKPAPGPFNGVRVTAAVQEDQSAEVPINSGKAMPAERKPASAQSSEPSVAAHNPGVAPEFLPAAVFERMSGELAEVAGVMSPLATLIIREHVEGLGESMEKFPKARLAELTDSLSRELMDEKGQADFRKRLA